ARSVVPSMSGLPKKLGFESQTPHPKQPDGGNLARRGCFPLSAANSLFFPARHSHVAAAVFENAQETIHRQRSSSNPAVDAGRRTKRIPDRGEDRLHSWNTPRAMLTAWYQSQATAKLSAAT